jgi:hypothetical protein
MTIVTFHTYVILLVIQSVLHGSFSNFKYIIRDIYERYHRYQIAYHRLDYYVGHLSVEIAPVHQISYLRPM